MSFNGSTSARSLADRGPTREALQEQVLSILAEVTRYPRDILLPAARLEEDLGIDSVKRAEIVAVLASRLELSEPEGASRVLPRTIGELVEAVEASIAGVPQPAIGGTATVPPLGPPPSDEHTRVAVAVDGSLLQQVVAAIAEVTRHPAEILTPQADLEDDLGLARDQRAAVSEALRSRFHFRLTPDRLAGARTIAELVAAIEPPPAPRPAAARPNGGPTGPQGGSLPERLPELAAAKPFTGRIALVTGSGHGLGKVIAQKLAALGATVVVNSFHSRQRGEDTAAEIVAAGAQAVHLWGSVANLGQLEQIFEGIERRFGGLDFFISNASNGILAPLKDVTPEHWDRAFRTCVIGLQQGALRAAELMRRRGGGKIVALSSSGSQRYLDYFGCMGPVKAAVECLVRYLAVELGADNIQVNTVTAGPIYGELLDKYPDYDKLRPRWEAVVPRGRLNDEQEVADAVVFLLSASGLSGSTLFLDAGGGQRISVPPGRTF